MSRHRYACRYGANSVDVIMYRHHASPHCRQIPPIPHWGPAILETRSRICISQEKNDMKKKKEIIYRCHRCDTTAEYIEGKDAPICCDERMVPEPLPQCTSAANPEMARTNDRDEPCDDNRGGKS